MRAKNEGSIYQVEHLATCERHKDATGATVYDCGKKGKHGRWFYARTLPNGKRVTVSAATREAVLKRRDELDAPLRESRPIPDRTLTVAGLFTLWLEVQEQHLEPNTLILYRSLSRDHILPTLGRIKVVELTKPDVDRWLGVLSRPTAKRAALAPATRSRIRQVLVAALNYAVDARVLTWNPAHSTKVTVRPSERAGESDYLTQDEMTRLVKAAHGDRLEALWLLLVGTGLRRGEALGLTRSALELDAGTVTVSQSLTRVAGRGEVRPTKTESSERTVPLPPFVVAALREHLRRQPALGGALVFRCSTGTPLNPGNVQTAFARLTERAGIGARHPHECRHGYAIALLESGTSLEVVSRLLGHSSIKTTADCYGKHARPAAQAAAVAALELAFGSVVR
jgi:integrase